MKNRFPNLDKSLFNINLPTGTPSAGAILIAEPFLREDYFNHSVITIIEHEAGGNSMGIVMNKPTGHFLSEAVEGFDRGDTIPIYCGGPMSCDRLFYIHRLGNLIPDATHICNDLFVGGDFESLKKLMNRNMIPNDLIRFFIGYSGWSEGQLEDEIADHAWAVGSATNISGLLTADEDTMWYQAVRSLGAPFRHWLYHPLHPHLN